MKPYVWMNVVSLLWVLFLMKVLPESDYLREHENDLWLYAYIVVGVTLPILVMIYVVDRIARRSEKQEIKKQT
ncbi:hypothetical protein [Brevibacillus ginsengisoli]|uniref:hypothetical protein n=1 Tax=Brevibacillus ginsengisoli TaxID=363854 RepID=UPI003CF7F304